MKAEAFDSDTINRYQSIPNYKGIRKDLWNGKYEAYKNIGRKRYSGYFKNIKEAVHWRHNFHPGLPFDLKVNSFPSTTSKTAHTNGQDFGHSFEDVWKLYLELSFAQFSTSTRNKRMERAKFFDGIFNCKMVDLNHLFFDDFMRSKRITALKIKKMKRFNFDFELKFLKAIFNWYRQNYDPSFINPILKRHRDLGTLRKAKASNKKMVPEDLVKFFQALKPFWRDVAECQFFFAGRISEVVGLQRESIDFVRNTVTIENVAVFNQTGDKHVLELKLPKNGEIRILNITKKMEEIFKRRLALGPKGPNFVFTNKGRPLTYRQCQYHYNKALKQAGLYLRGYHSTHFLRHTTATITRMLFGNLDHAQAMTGHKDSKILQHYASLASPIQVEASNKLDQFMAKVEGEYVQTCAGERSVIASE